MKRPRISNRQLAPRKLPPECFYCGSVNPWVENTAAISAPFRKVTHSLHASVNECRHCNAIATTEEQNQAISQQVQEIHRDWISKKFKESQQELGLSIRALVELTGIPQATLARASSGERLIEATTEELLWQKIDQLRSKQLTNSMLNMSTAAFSEAITFKVQSSKPSLYASMMTASSPLSLKEDESAYLLENPPAFTFIPA